MDSLKHLKEQKSKLCQPKWNQNLPKKTNKNIWVFPEWISLKSTNSVIRGKTQKKYGVQEYCPTSNVYITNGNNKNHISITTSG